MMKSACVYVIGLHRLSFSISMLGPEIQMGTSYQGRSQKFVLGWYKFLLHNTAVRYTSSLTSSAAISAQHNFQGLILGGNIYRYTPRRYAPAG